MVEYAKKTGSDRIELYTENYAIGFSKNNLGAISPYKLSAQKANELKLGINAGHDLDSKNLKFFNKNIPGLLEVSIGHALISDALYYGLEKTIKTYLDQLIR